MARDQLDRIWVSPSGSAIYLSGEQSASDVEALRARNIGRILSLGSAVSFPASALPHQQHMVVDILDEPTANLLKYVDACVDFVLSESEKYPAVNVLVHCVHGHSRSAAIVCAILMKETGASLSEAEREIKMHRTISINSGFLLQLGVWGRMRFPTNGDPLESERAQALARWFSFACKQDFLSAEAVSDVFSDADHPFFSGSSGDGSGSSVKCRKCRQKLVYSSNIIDHDEPLVQLVTHKHQHQYQHQGVVRAEGSSHCGSLFIEPLASLIYSRDGGSICSGRLNCPNCRAKIGEWNFGEKGVQCSCSVRVKPGICITRKTVDL